MSQEKKLRVLIAEDDYLVFRMLEGLLLELGYEILGQAGSGLEALAMTQELYPDIIVMDVQMPDMDGIQACLRIQELVPTPVVIMTAYENPGLVSLAAEAGVGAYLVKPPNGRDLERALIIARARFQDLMALRELNQELSAANEQLDTFAHMVAHDLKHFLSPILTRSELLYMDYETLSAEEARVYLRHIADTVRDMDNVIEALLLLAHLHIVGHGDVEFLNLDMGAVVNEALRRLNHMISKHEVQLKLPDQWPIVNGYASWIVEVWINYISNAIKYGGPHPVIELGWTPYERREELTADFPSLPDADGRMPCQPGMICFWVRDYGEGVPADRLPLLFKPFGFSEARRLRGGGLGLSIVKDIVDYLGGEVGVLSVAGEGSKFGFTVRVAEDTALASEAGNSLEQGSAYEE